MVHTSFGCVKEEPLRHTYSVQTGITNGTRTQILSGVKEGTVVVVDMKEAASNDESSESTEGSDEKSPFSPGPPSKKKK